MIGMFDHQRREKGTKLHSITRMTITTWLSIVALGHSATYMFPESQIHQSFSTTAELPATMPQTTDPRSNSRILPKSFQNRKKRNAGEPPQPMFSILRESINGLPIHKMWFFVVCPYGPLCHPCGRHGRKQKRKNHTVCPDGPLCHPCGRPGRGQKRKKTRFRKCGFFRNNEKTTL